MGYPSGRSADSIGDTIGVKASANLQVTRDGGFLANEISVEKANGEGYGISVYCFRWDSLLGISIT